MKTLHADENKNLPDDGHHWKESTFGVTPEMDQEREFFGSIYFH